MKVVHDNKPMDLSKSEDHPMNATHMMHTCLLAHLAEKLKKLMETPSKTDRVLMECGSEDQKGKTKCQQATITCKLGQKPHKTKQPLPKQNGLAMAQHPLQQLQQKQFLIQQLVKMMHP